MVVHPDSMVFQGVDGVVHAQIFANLISIGPAGAREELSDGKDRCPFYTYDWVQWAHPGLRSYPFLAQVCPCVCCCSVRCPGVL